MKFRFLFFRARRVKVFKIYIYLYIRVCLRVDPDSRIPLIVEGGEGISIILRTQTLSSHYDKLKYSSCSLNSLGSIN